MESDARNITRWDFASLGGEGRSRRLNLGAFPQFPRQRHLFATPTEPLRIGASLPLLAPGVRGESGQDVHV